MHARIALIACLSLTAAPVQAQDFLGGLARRAAASAAGQIIGRTVANQVSPGADAPATADPARRGGRADNAPEAEGLQGLPEEEREKACEARIPKMANGGRDLPQQEAFGRCMGPRYGEGG